MAEVEEGRTDLTVRAAELSKGVDALIREMDAVKIDTQDQYDWMNGWLRRNKDSQKLVDELFEEDRVKAKADYDAVLARKGAFKKPLEAAEAVARSKMSVYATKAEADRRKAQADADAAARKKAEDDRLVEAQNLSSMGRPQQAVELLDKRLKVERPDAAPKVGRLMESWAVEVVDKGAFLEEAVCIPGLLDCVEVSATKAAAFLKGKGQEAFPGLKVTKSFRPVL